MEDLTLGERGFEQLRSLLDSIRSRPVVLVAVLVTIGSLGSTVPTFYSAWTFPSISFNYRVLGSSAGLGPLMQLGLVVAAVLLLIDRLSAASSRRRAMFAILAVLAAVGVMANMASLIIALSISVPPTVGGAQVAEGRSVLVLDYLAPAALAALGCWIAVIGVRFESAHEVEAA